MHGRAHLVVLDALAALPDLRLQLVDLRVQAPRQLRDALRDGVALCFCWLGYWIKGVRSV